jgi:predicted dinucleotide-binding enzyme
MRIAVYGAGGVGGYFGGRLAQAGADVRFIARGAHLRALRERGLRVRSVKGDFAVRVPALHGLGVRRAAERGVPVPMSGAVDAILKPWAVRNQRTGR